MKKSLLINQRKSAQGFSYEAKITSLGVKKGEKIAWMYNGIEEDFILYNESGYEVKRIRQDEKGQEMSKTIFEYAANNKTATLILHGTMK